MRGTRREVVVVDFGGQYAHLIARRVRELGFYARVVGYDSLSLRDLEGAGALILSGGPHSVYEEGAPMPDTRVIRRAIDSGLAVLGICYGHQLLSRMLGGEVRRGEKGEYGSSTLEVVADDVIFRGTPRLQRVWMSHRDVVERAPPGSRVLARTSVSRIAAFRLVGARVYGLQFHPEVRHTEYGSTILRNFLVEVAELEPSWRPEELVGEIVRRIRDRYRGGNVLVAASGGVDSTTAAYLVKMAIGAEPIHLVVIDTGLLRRGEAGWAQRTLKSLGFKHVHLVDAAEEFLDALRGVDDPEEKRRAIAEVYFRVLEREAERLEREYGEFRYLVQGTIYPDRIESGRAGRSSDRIKSHHNVTLPERLRLEVIEPLADFYKDEVRRIARALGLPGEVVERHPFPGPGLAVRVVGEVTREKLEIVRRATEIVEEELRRAGLYGQLWQAFPVLLPVKTTGVKGDARSYEYAIAIRAVVSEDAMTAEFAKLPWDVLERIASRIVNEVEGVNRVLYDVTNKPPATIEFE
ncbi:MAG: GMP synthase (glutamine-hydrolyzing) [Thermoprotei archaeon]|nr:MAG: GMP synthase (glutamine-hydrolyzing) [Thermoprotei archaeon]